MIKAVLFDYGGVLTPGGFDGSLVRNFAAIYGVDESEIELSSSIRDQLMDGRLSTEDFFDQMNAKFPGKPKASPQKIIDRSPESLLRSQQVYDLVSQLREAGIRTVIFSNAMEFLARERIKRGDYDEFDPVFLSYRDKMAKPDIKYYNYVLKKLDLPANEILFIDDKEQNLIPARKLGMHTILFESPDKCLNAANDLLESINGVSLE